MEGIFKLDPKKDMICHKCNTPLFTVCISSIIRVCEDGFEFECFECYLKESLKDKYKYKFLSNSYEEIIKESLRKD